MLFSGLGIAASGMSVYKTWIDALADNVANINNVTTTSEPAFRERFVIAGAKQYTDEPGTGAEVQGVAFGDAEGRLIYEPAHPLADANGYVRYPDIDLSTQMSSLLIAQRAYQMNVSVFERARDAYQRILEIGR